MFGCPEVFWPRRRLARRRRRRRCSSPATFTAALSGTATVTLNAAQDNVAWNITHTGYAYESGAIAIPLAADAAAAASPIMGSAAIAAAQVADLKAGKLYVNVHSATNAGGELRGPLTP